MVEVASEADLETINEKVDALMKYLGLEFDGTPRSEYYWNAEPLRVIKSGGE